MKLLFTFSKLVPWAESALQGVLYPCLQERYPWNGLLLEFSISPPPLPNHIVVGQTGGKAWGVGCEWLGRRAFQYPLFSCLGCTCITLLFFYVLSLFIIIYIFVRLS